MKQRLLLTWNSLYPVLIIIFFIPEIIAITIILFIIAIIDLYIGSAICFIIWIITGKKYYWFILKKSATLYGFLINKITF